jgi:hypothetical protein
MSKMCSPENPEEKKTFLELGNHYEQLADQRELMGIDDGSGDGRNYRRLAEWYFDLDMQQQQRVEHNGMERTL